MDSKSGMGGAPGYLDKVVNPWFLDLVLMQDLLSDCAHRFFRSRGLVSVNLPLTTGSISSPVGLASDSTPVEINIGKIRTYLADSMQFYLEYGCRFHKDGCFYLMPSYRGDNIDETHLQQFFHLEVETSGGFEKAINLAEDFIRFFCASIVERRNVFKCLEELNHIATMAESAPFLSINFEDALSRLSSVPGATEAIENSNLTRITRLGERAIMEEIGHPIWLTAPPASIVPFYQALGASGTALCGDLLLGVGEVCGLGERHIDGLSTRSALKMQGLEAKSYEWYIEMKSRYPMQTSGFGIGTERLLCWVFRKHDIRCMELVPRRNDANLYP